MPHFSSVNLKYTAGLIYLHVYVNSEWNIVYLPLTESVRLLFLVVKSIRQWISNVFSTVLSQMSSRISRALEPNINNVYSNMKQLCLELQFSFLTQQQSLNSSNIHLKTQSRSCLSQYVATLDICAAWGSAGAPWPRPENSGVDGGTGNPSSAPGGNTMTGSWSTSLVCPAGQWTANGFLQGSTLDKDWWEEQERGQRGKGNTWLMKIFSVYTFLFSYCFIGNRTKITNPQLGCGVWQPRQPGQICQIQPYQTQWPSQALASAGTVSPGSGSQVLVC